MQPLNRDAHPMKTKVQLFFSYLKLALLFVLTLCLCLIPQAPMKAGKRRVFRTPNLRPAGWITAALLLLPLCIMAADGPPADGSVAPAQPGNILHLIIAAVVPCALWFLRGLVPRLPSWALPLLAPVLGVAIDFIAAGGFSANSLWAAVAGSAGVGLRELQNQVRRRITDGPQPSAA